MNDEQICALMASRGVYDIRHPAGTVVDMDDLRALVAAVQAEGTHIQVDLEYPCCQAHDGKKVACPLLDLGYHVCQAGAKWPDVDFGEDVDFADVLPSPTCPLRQGRVVVEAMAPKETKPNVRHERRGYVRSMPLLKKEGL